MNEYREGQVIEFKDKGKYKLAVILRVEKKRLRVLVEDGREASIQDKHIVMDLGQHWHVEASQHALQHALKRLDQEVEALREQGDIEVLWEISSEELSKGAPLPLLAELLFGENGPLEQYACLRLLREDQIYFKRRGEKFEPRTAEQVALIQRDLKRREREEAEQLKFIELCMGLLEKPKAERREALAHCRDSMLMKKLRELEQLLLEIHTRHWHSKWDEILDEIERRLGHHLEGRKEVRAQVFLIELGYWDEDIHLEWKRSHLAEPFEQEVLDQARALFEQVIDQSDYRDLRRWKTFTIDAPSTKDLDDALSFEKTEDGWVVGIHIAHPLAWIQWDSPLERASRFRASTVYLPDRIVPMFPLSLSEDLFSLVQGKDRPALSFIAHLNRQWEIVDEEVVLSLIHVDRRLSYEEADRAFEAGGTYGDRLRHLYTFADWCLTYRRHHGAIEIEIPNLKVEVKDGKIEVKPESMDSPSQRIVSEMMVLANRMAASFCIQHQIPCSYRVQPAPNSEALERALKYPEVFPRAFATMKVMQAAYPSATPGPHAGLGIEHYVQVTSPIRRYGDLAMHYQIRAYLLGQSPLDPKRLEQALALSESNLSEVRRISRERERYWILKYLLEHRERIWSAVILDYPEARGDKALILLEETLTRLKILTGKRWPLGTRLRVQLTRIEVYSGYLQGKWVDILETPHGEE